MIRPHFHNATISIYDPGYRLQSYSMIFRVTFCADEISACVFLYLSGIVILNRYFQFVLDIYYSYIYFLVFTVFRRFYGIIQQISQYHTEI